MRRTAALALALVLLLMSTCALAARFVYEGHLEDLGQPANGRYDIRLGTFAHEVQGATLAAPVTFDGVEVKQGRFRLDVELPLVESDQVWLEVAVRATGEPTFVGIPGRTKAIAAPLIGACWSTTGDSGVNPATNFIGTLDAQAFAIRSSNKRVAQFEVRAVGGPGGVDATNVLLGSSNNSIAAGIYGATIAGGGTTGDPLIGVRPNIVSGDFGTIGGGAGNVTGTLRGATVGGGFLNSASSSQSTVGGGGFNLASGSSSTVSGGGTNTASAEFGVVAGGSRNVASGVGSVVGGGSSNSASGLSSTVGGGTSNCAGGQGSWAGGVGAKVRPGSSSGLAGDGCAGVPLATQSAGDGGTFVWSSGQLGDFVSTGSSQFLVRALGGIGFNTNDPLTAFDVVGNRNGAHTALIQNTSTSNPSGLAIRLNVTTPTSSSNFLTFERNTGSNIGSVEGNGSGGVVFNTSGGDYAEYLPLATGVAKARLSPGRVVALRDGAVSLDTAGAQQLGVISTNPAVSGNDPGEAKRDAHALIAFLGQVEVAVLGPVAAGDFLIPSGRGDGRAMAAAPTALATELIGAVIGRAWTASADDEGTVRALVGLNPADAAQSAALARLAEENARLRSESLNLHQRLERVEALLGKPPAERR